MKEIFPGYYRKSEKEIKDIWTNCIICFDANVLLNLYRYSKQTRAILIDLIGKFNERIWLPHQSALEYNRNRYEVIVDQEKAYNDFIDRIEKIKSDLQSNSKPPFLSDELHKSLNKVFEKVNSEVNQSIDSYKEFLKDDPVYDSICKLFDGKISDRYDDVRLSEIYSEGEKRFEDKIPPGFEDAKDKNGVEKYGDLVIWNQIIDKAKKENNDIIFITDERKRDWWWKLKDGRTIGPRQELIEEIHKEAKVDFHMYSSERFLRYGQQYFREKINKEAIEEIQEMKRSDLQKIEKLRRLRAHKKRHISKDLFGLDEKEFYDRQNYLRKKWLELSERIIKIDEFLQEAQSDPHRKMSYIRDLEIHLKGLKEEKEMLDKELQRNMFRYDEAKQKWFLRGNSEGKESSEGDVES